MGTSQDEARKRRKDVVLVIVKNDPEAEVTARLAEDTIAVIELTDRMHGTTLDEYTGVLERIRKVRNCKEVWTFELPGLVTEAAIVAAGYELHIIDHHEYGKLNLDRTRNEWGNLRPSSLAQFIELGGYTDDEIRHKIRYEPKIVYGIGIYDASVGWGLRAAGYSSADIFQVLDLRSRIMRGTTSNFDQTIVEARKIWAKRDRRGWYSLMMAGGNVAPAIVQAAVEDATRNGHEEDARPMVLAANDGMVITVRHVSQDVIAHLMKTISKGFVFGTRNCFGVDNRHRGGKCVTLDDVIAALETAPR